MKYIILLAVSLGVITSQAADRCTGKISKTLIEHEMVADMYYDVAIHQVICELAGTAEQHKKSVEQWQAVRTQYKDCIIAAQDAMVAHMGGEAPFENFYAAIGNQISYLNLPDPCGRVDALSAKLLKSNYSCRGGVVKAYKPSFEDLAKKFEAKSARKFKRICD